MKEIVFANYSYANALASSVRADALFVVNAITVLNSCTIRTLLVLLITIVIPSVYVVIFPF